MKSLRAPYSRRGLRLFLGAQASLPAYFDRLVFWLIVTAFLFITSPTLFAQTDDNAAIAGVRIAELARTPALPGNATVTLGLNHSIFGSAVSPKAGLNLWVTDFWRIRASYGRGFRAPDLGQLFFSLPQSDIAAWSFSAPCTTSPTAAIRMWAHCCRSFALSWGARSASECASRGRRSAGKAQRAAWRPSRLAPSAGRHETCEVNPGSAPPVN